jgi:uncharacterized membrane protein
MRRAFRWLLAVGMVAVGVLHLARPDGFVKIVPRALPAPLVLVVVSGICEIAGGIGLLFEKTRRAASLGLVALYVAVFPANVNMAVNDIQPEGMHLSPVLLWARLPLQLAFIALAFWVGRSGAPPVRSDVPPRGQP